ncbi:MAG TPA: efflux RND transporter periplasmic adaptor subunit [Thermoanaerobaculia bacterium]|nr:efflux RND transporter periplasmic adaptor subunit [Thermoanaerobaculia bacterium]
MRLPAFVLTAVCLAMAAMAACGGGTSEVVETTDRVPVTVALARRGPIRATVLVTGTVKPAPGAELAVTAPQAARIAALPRGEGDRVKKGDLLVRFEIPSLEADAAGRRSDLARGEARLETARAAARRVEGLFERGIAARKEVEDAKRELAEAEAGVAEAKSAGRAAGVLAGREVVRAPFDGVVASRLHNPGDLVDSSASDPILKLIDPARLQAEAAVPLSDLPRVAAGSPARVLGPPPYPPEAAKVVARPAAVDPATGAANVRLAFARPTALPAGTPVQIEILGEEHPSAVLVPAAAVVQEGPESSVFVVDAASRAHRRPVAVGWTAQRETEVLSGLAPGERVIVTGQQGLPDGALVTPAPAAPR